MAKYFTKYDTMGSVRTNALTSAVNDYIKSLDGTLISNLTPKEFHEAVNMRVVDICKEFPRLKPFEVGFYDYIETLNGSAAITSEISGACLRIYKVKNEL